MRDGGTLRRCVFVVIYRCSLLTWIQNMTIAVFPARTVVFLALCVFALAAHGGETYSQIMDDGRDYSGPSRWIVFAALHAIPIVIVALAFNSYFLTTVAVLVVGWIAVSVGSASYTAIDLFFVFLGLAAAVFGHRINKPPAGFYIPKKVEEPPPQTKKGSSTGLLLGMIGVGLLGMSFLYILSSSKRTATPLPLSTHHTVVRPAQPSAPPLTPSSAQKPVPRPSKQQGDLTHCLDLKTNAEVAQCAR